MKAFFTFYALIFFSTVYCQQITFNKSFGSLNNVIDLSGTLVESPGTGYIVPFKSWPYPLDSSAIGIAILDYNGNLSLLKSISHDTIGAIEPWKITSSSDGNFVLTGVLRAKPSNILYGFLIKLDSNADIIWSQFYSSGQDATWLADVTETLDKGFLLCGISYNYLSGGSDYQIYVIKTDSIGNIIWNQYYGEPVHDEYPTSIIELHDSTIIISGYQFTFNYGFNTGYFLKLNQYGNQLIQTKIYHYYDLAIIDAFYSSDGFIYICGEQVEIPSPIYKSKGYVAKLDTDLNLIWSQTLGTGSYLEYFTEIIENSNNELVLSGASSRIGLQDGWLSAFNKNGNALWERIFQMNINYMDIFWGLINSADGGYVTCGSTFEFDSTLNNWNQQLWVVKVDSLGCDSSDCPTILWNSLNEITEKHYFKIYPNPYSNYTNIEYSVSKETFIYIYNITGETVKEINLPVHGNKFDLESIEMNSGIYFCRFVQDDKIIHTQKLIIMK